MSHFKTENAPYSISAGALPQTLLGELSAPPDPLAGFKGGLLLRGENREEERRGEEKGRGEEKREGGGKEGREGERKGREWTSPRIY